MNTHNKHSHNLPTFCNSILGMKIGAIENMPHFQRGRPWWLPRQPVCPVWRRPAVLGRLGCDGLPPPDEVYLPTPPALRAALQTLKRWTHNWTQTRRKPVRDVLQPAHVASSSELRGVVSCSLRISEKSTVTQEIVMDAACPYVKFNTEVPAGVNCFLPPFVILKLNIRPMIHYEHIVLFIVYCH